MVAQGDIVNMLSQAVTTVVLAAAPMLVTAMVVGLVISIFQATTQVNEQTLAFVPKIVAVLLVLLLFAPFIFSLLGGYVTNLFELINTLLVLE